MLEIKKKGGKSIVSRRQYSLQFETDNNSKIKYIVSLRFCQKKGEKIMKRIIFGMFGGFIGCLVFIYTLFNKACENDGFRVSFIEGWKAFVRAAVFGEESMARPTSWRDRRPYTYRDYMRDHTKRRYGYRPSMMQDQDDNDIEEVEHVSE